MPAEPAITEAAILQRVLAIHSDDLTPEVTRSWLALRFDTKTTATIRSLLRKNNRGTISGDERLTLEKYLRVGQVLDLLHARARLVTERAPTAE